MLRSARNNSIAIGLKHNISRTFTFFFDVFLSSSGIVVNKSRAQFHGLLHNNAIYHRSIISVLRLSKRSTDRLVPLFRFLGQSGSFCTAEIHVVSKKYTQNINMVRFVAISGTRRKNVYLNFGPVDYSGVLSMGTQERLIFSIFLCFVLFMFVRGSVSDLITQIGIYLCKSSMIA